MLSFSSLKLLIILKNWRQTAQNAKITFVYKPGKFWPLFYQIKLKVDRELEGTLELIKTLENAGLSHVSTIFSTGNEDNNNTLSTDVTWLLKTYVFENIAVQGLDISWRSKILWMLY